MSKFVNDVIGDMQRQEIEEFKQKISIKIRKISQIQTQINQLKIELTKEKDEFKKLNLEATNYAELIV